MVDGRDGTGPAGRRRPPLGFLGMIGLVAAIEWGLGGHDLEFTTPMHWDWRVLGKAATRPERVAGKDVLIFGDSLVKFGVMPHVIRERSGKVAYNFALHTGQATTSYFMLRRALDAGASPSAVVLDLTPHLLSRGPETNMALWPELLSTGECLDLTLTIRAADFLTSTMLARAFSTLKERHEIRAAIVDLFRGKGFRGRSDVARFRRNWKVNEGAQLFADGPAPEIDLLYWNGALYEKWAPHPANLAYLDRFLALARARDIPVYWLLPPIHPGVQGLTEQTGYDSEYTRFVRRTQARFPGTVVVDARHSGFTAGHFFDGIHVNRRGAMRLSTALADTLADRPDREVDGRWVSLELGRGGVLDLPLEDVYQSAAVLRDLGARSRR